MAKNKGGRKTYDNFNKKDTGTLKVGFLGGVGEIGKNMTVIEYGDDMLIIDAGLTFPTEEMPGIDIVIPSLQYIKDNKARIKGIILTHGHEDHIGAVPFLVEEVKAPIYGSELTLKLVGHKIIERGIKDPEYFVVKAGDCVNAGAFEVEFFHMCHSVGGAFALAIKMPKGTIFMTGDFKVDYTPADNENMDFGKLGALGDKGVLLMLGESTNVERDGHTVSERTVGETIDGIFASNEGRRIIVATFSSNVHRLQQIIEIALKYDRFVAFSGRSMHNVYEIGKELGIIKLDESRLVELDRLKGKKFPEEKLLILSTGSQGEPMSALSRMAAGKSNQISVGKNDTVILSASPIPGNERAVYSTINNLYKLGAKVIYHTLKDIHVSGHAHKEELKLMLSLIRPKYFMPVHGEFRHQKLHSVLAEEMGVKAANIYIPEIGHSIEVSSRGLRRLDNIPAGNTYVDGAVVEDNMDMVLKDRKSLSVEGVMIIWVDIRLEDGAILSGPEIMLRGVVVNEELISKLKIEIAKIVEKSGYRSADDRSALKKAITRFTREKTYNVLKTNPMIVTIIIES